MLALLPGRVPERAAGEISHRERSASAPDTHGGCRADVWQPQIAPAFFGVVKALLSWVAAFAGICLLGTTAARATVAVYSNDMLSVGLGGLLQLQFKDDHPIGGNSEQEILVQRLRLEFETALQRHWQSRLQLDFEPIGDTPSIMDAWVRYSGFELGSLSFGNQYAPFSRELLTASKYQALIERAFTGDNEYGVPDRQPGVVFSGSAFPVDYSIGWFHAGIKPSTAEINFESPVNDDGQYTGNLYAGRLQYTPWGETVSYAQGNREARKGLSFGVNIYRWANDNRGQTPVPGDDWSSVNGYGLDAAWRDGKISADAGYNWIRGTSRDPVTNSGIIRLGEGRLRAWAVQGGYMLIAQSLELVASIQDLRADAWDASWKRCVAGVNYFINGDDLKLQFSIEHDSDQNGIAGSDANIAYAQFQMAF